MNISVAVNYDYDETGTKICMWAAGVYRFSMERIRRVMCLITTGRVILRMCSSS